MQQPPVKDILRAVVTAAAFGIGAVAFLLMLRGTSHQNREKSRRRRSEPRRGRRPSGATSEDASQASTHNGSNLQSHQHNSHDHSPTAPNAMQLQSTREDENGFRTGGGDDSYFPQEFCAFGVRSQHSTAHATANFVGCSEEDSNDEPITLSIGRRRLRDRRAPVCGESTDIAASKEFKILPSGHPKTAQEKEFLHKTLRKCHLFTQLDEEEIDQVVGGMDPETFHRGDFVTTQGEAATPQRFFVMFRGEISVILDSTVIKVLGVGSVFNETHIMFVEPKSSASHRVDSATATLFSLGAEEYRHTVTRAAINKRELYEGFLDRVSWLSGLTHVEKLQLADCLQPLIFNQGDYLIEFNTTGDFVFLILEGTVDVYGRDKGEVMYVCSFTVGDCVGELEFINHHRTVADVRARGRVKAARLHRDHFEMCMGPIIDVLRRTASMDEKYWYYQNAIRGMRRTEESRQ